MTLKFRFYKEKRMRILNKLEMLMDLFKQMDDGEVIIYSTHEEEDYDEYIGFNRKADYFYVRSISNGEEEVQRISLKNVFTRMDEKLDEIIKITEQQSDKI
jgi:TRAP-type mannitol/chloroaromatic compound transport system substrate-binding protein